MRPTAYWDGLKYSGSLEEAQPTQEFERQVSGEEWHGDSADQANDLREYEEELEIREQSRRPGEPNK